MLETKALCKKLCDSLDAERHAILAAKTQIQGVLKVSSHPASIVVDTQKIKELNTMLEQRFHMKQILMHLDQKHQKDLDESRAEDCPVLLMAFTRAVRKCTSCSADSSANLGGLSYCESHALTPVHVAPPWSPSAPVARRLAFDEA